MLKKAQLLHDQSRDYGFYWENLEQVLDQVRSECQEVKEAYAQDPAGTHLQEELGDLLLGALEIVFYCGFDPKTCLDEAMTKYETRFNRLVAYAQADGLNTLKGLPMATLLGYWKRAKEES